MPKYPDSPDTFVGVTSKVNKQVEEIHQVIGRICERLTPVIRYAEPLSGQTTESANTSPLSSHLSDIKNRLDDMYQSIDL